LSSYWVSVHLLQESCSLAVSVLESLLKLVILIGALMLTFGMAYSHLALHLYGGELLSTGAGNLLIKSNGYELKLYMPIQVQTLTFVMPYPTHCCTVLVGSCRLQGHETYCAMELLVKNICFTAHVYHHIMTLIPPHVWNLHVVRRNDKCPTDRAPCVAGSCPTNVLTEHLKWCPTLQQRWKSVLSQTFLVRVSSDT